MFDAKHTGWMSETEAREALRTLVRCFPDAELENSGDLWRIWSPKHGLYLGE